MNGEHDPRNDPTTNAPGPQPPPGQSESAGATSHAAAKDKRRSFAGMLDVVLNDIPLIGKYLASIRQSFGWAGVLLILGGFLLAVVLTYTGKLPAWAVSSTYKNPAAPAPVKEYELVSDRNAANAVLAQALTKAEADMELAGVAAKFFDPRLLKEKMEQGFKVNLVVLDPCSDAVLKTKEDTGHDSRSRTNIFDLLRSIKHYREQLPPGGRRQLQVRLSKRPATMVVAMFDRRRDLYAYWCPYGKPCTVSPVLVVKDYAQKKKETDPGRFFEQHYDTVFNDAEPVDFDKYEPGQYSADKPCHAPIARVLYGARAAAPRAASAPPAERTR